MVPISEVEKLALDLPEHERALLAEHLLESLPRVLEDEDDGLAEALRRHAELEANPEIGLTLEQFRAKVRERWG